MELVQFLFLKSAGVGVGIFLGTLLGLGFRSRSGKTEGLLRGSVLLTALVVGVAALLAMMLFTWIGMR